MALAQGTDLLLLDEPTTYLDVAHQVEMLDLLADLNRTPRHHRRDGAARPEPVRALRRPPRRHDATARSSPRARPPRSSPRRRCAAVFGLDSRVITDPVSHTPLVVPVGTPPRDRRRPA